jgi:hypothetical protein
MRGCFDTFVWHNLNLTFLRSHFLKNFNQLNYISGVHFDFASVANPWVKFEIRPPQLAKLVYQPK